MAAEGRGPGRGRARTLALLLLLLAAACAPRLAPPGPGATAPHLDEEHFVTVDGLALPLRVWRPDEAPPRAVVLALHGFNFHSGIFDEPAAHLAARGLAVYAYDQRGFGAAPHRGLWAGTEALTGDLKTAVRLLRARHPGVPVYVLGDSMGGAVALVALTDPDAPPVAGAILVAPAVWARETMPITHRVALWVGVRTLPWLTVSGRGLGIQASDNIEALRALGRDPLIIRETRVDALHGMVDLMDAALAAAPRLETPALLLYGQNDQVIPEAPTRVLWRALPADARARQRRALYENGWHLLLRDLQAEVVLDDIVHWIDDPAAPLPSGAEAHALARLDGEPM